MPTVSVSKLLTGSGREGPLSCNRTAEVVRVRPDDGCQFTRIGHRLLWVPDSSPLGRFTDPERRIVSERNPRATANGEGHQRGGAMSPGLLRAQGFGTPERVTGA